MYKLKNDLMFKMAFCTKNSKDNLMHFLKSIYNENIVQIEYEPFILEDKYINTKKKYVDLIVQLDNGELINIEINTSFKKYIRSRNASYLLSSYVQDIEKDKDYKKIDKHIQINFTWGLAKKYNIKESYKLRNESGKEVYIDSLEIIEYNMDKIMNSYYNKDEKIIKQYKPMIMLDLDAKEIRNLGNGDKFMEKMSKVVDDLNADKKLVRWISDEEEIEKTRRSEILEAKEEGIEQTKKESAINFYKNGVSKETICQSLNITSEQLNYYLNTKD